jgi:hypothetical protein
MSGAGELLVCFFLCTFRLPFSHEMILPNAPNQNDCSAPTAKNRMITRSKSQKVWCGRETLTICPRGRGTGRLSNTEMCGKPQSN